MKFVDEVSIHVEAGNGGNGCLSFRREKYVPFGGPNGGNGGTGGSVYVKTNAHLNTLVDYRYKRIFRAQHGRPGQGQLKTGKNGNDIILTVPIGTKIYELTSHELLVDLINTNELFLLAKGGNPGYGNAHFKSSTNQAPRKTTKGGLGEIKDLKLELNLLADVGLLGLPNAGKSTFIRAVSNAKPKIADYPFTTTYPYLGVVNIATSKSFVVADIPGLIEGASKGAGMGIKFLKHLQRTKVLLHLVDIASQEIELISKNIATIEQELQTFDLTLANKPRWLVLNKVDLISEKDQQKLLKQINKQFKDHTKIYPISAINRKGVTTLCLDLMGYLEKQT